jgi:hypothetical protein
MLVIGFELKINGKLICSAGVGGLQFLTASLTWMKRKEEELNVSVGGMAFQANGDREEVRWVNQPVASGDEIVIRILDRLEYDEPVQRLPSNPNQERETMRQILESLKRQLGGGEEMKEP